ncbi:unnamed protein product [Periconia digitata]|uniref:Uncharacterized protein n=1 Tax=Periconia digitata TaxID=1303443 RepID=A0A9W4UBP1_9PLEO|nr:unnamed protein product [Periconia digitata]
MCPCVLLSVCVQTITWPDHRPSLARIMCRAYTSSTPGLEALSTILPSRALPVHSKVCSILIRPVRVCLCIEAA